MEENKKEMVLDEGEKSSKKLILIVGIIILIAVGGYFFLKSDDATGAVVSSGLAPMNYDKIRVDIMDVKTVEQGDLVGISLDDLMLYKLVHFKFNDKPLMAYIDNKGNVITSVAMCEPFRNDHDFFIQNNILVCAKCWTRWKLTSHAGISGGCKKYPPEVLSNEIIDGKILVSKQEVIDWRPRV